MSQTVVITGGAAGIGRTMARAFSARGDRVYVGDADPSAIEAMRDEDPNIIPLGLDVTSAKDVDAFFGEITARGDTPDVVCANAGIGGPAGQFEDIELAGWQETLDVNLNGAFLTSQWAARLMKPKKQGLILFTSSTAGLFGYPYRSPYAVAKWGLIGLTKTLAMELGRFGLRVNALCPGAVEGPRMDRVVASEARAKGMTETQVRAQYVDGVSLRSWVKPQDIANMALMLASPLGDKISGQALAIDGHTETLAP